jgi:hypothetical protein
MNDLISKKALLEAIERDKHAECDNPSYVLQLIENAPTVQREGWVNDKKRMDYLSNGGWEVLQDPKYWTDGLNVRQVIDRNIAAPKE